MKTRLEIPRARKCACGCGTPLDGLRADALWATDACRKRGREAPSAEIARNRGGSSTSGLQVAFWKAVDTLEGPPLFVPHQVAVQVLSSALSDRQWELLAGRYPRNGVPR